MSRLLDVIAADAVKTSGDVTPARHTVIPDVSNAVPTRAIKLKQNRIKLLSHRNRFA